MQKRDEKHHIVLALQIKNGFETPPKSVTLEIPNPGKWRSGKTQTGNDLQKKNPLWYKTGGIKPQ
jgi:hypothetical protein